MYYQQVELMRKLGLQEPKQYKGLSYINKTLDLIFLSDNIQAIEQYYQKYPNNFFEESTLRGIIERGAINCFEFFFSNTKSKKFFFEKIFKNPSFAFLGPQCIYFYCRNKNIINSIEQKCNELFPEKNTLDFFDSQEQIEYCCARFASDGRLHLADKLLNKLRSPLYMINNQHVFEYLYNHSPEFTEVYLKKIKEKELFKPFLLALFSSEDINQKRKSLNFFDKFTKAKICPENKSSWYLKTFIEENIKNKNINQEFQELILAYCLYNNNSLLFNDFYKANPIKNINFLKNISQPYVFLDINENTYAYRQGNHTFGLNMTNNALKIFHDSKTNIEFWKRTLKNEHQEHLFSDICSLFCVGNKNNLRFALKTLNQFIDWQNKDQNANTFGHYLVNFFSQTNQHFKDSSRCRDMVSYFSYLAEEHPETLAHKNHEGLNVLTSFLNMFKNNKNLTIPENDEQKKEILRLEKLNEYLILENQLNTNTSPTRKLKI